MKDSFQKFQTFFYQTILKHEGGLSKHPQDKGSTTKYGIASRFFGDKVGNVENLTPYLAMLIYFVEYFITTWIFDVWNSTKNWKLTTKLVDMAINIGIEKTKQIYDFVLKTYNPTDTNATIQFLIFEQKKYYQKIIEKNPSQKVFLNGWLKRAEYTGEDT